MLSKIERCWLVSIRLAWRFRDDPAPAERLIDNMLNENGLQPASGCVTRLISSLQAEGASDLYVERIIHPEPTGDERDLLAALRCCYLEDPLGAERALGALLPPGSGVASLRAIQDIALAHRLDMPCRDTVSFDWPSWMNNPASTGEKDVTLGNASMSRQTVRVLRTPH